LRALATPIIRFLWPTVIVGRENFDSVNGAVVICNHYAVPDTLIPAARLYKDELHVLAKAEAFKTKIGNRFLTAVGAIPVHRGEPDVNAYKQIMKVLKSDKKLMMYPEGTRNKAGTNVMKEFKQGASLFAIRSEKPILPMMYFKMHKLFQRNYLYIGKPFTLEQFKKTGDLLDEAVDYVYEKMCALRAELDEYVIKTRGEKYYKRHSKSAQNNCAELM
jgi:1-acyl-sn-glycerol-3-phosphate acyltransferase